MPDGRRSLSFRRAALGLEARLRELTGSAPLRLDETELRRCYPRRGWIAGWRVAIEFEDGKSRHIDVVAGPLFPMVPVRTALRERPAFMTWPHVEEDGTLCLLPNLADCDPDDPVAVAENLLGRSVRLVEELIEGTIVERDFQEEFLTYWAYRAHAKGDSLISILDPVPPSRSVRIWRGDGIEVVGEDDGQVEGWVRRRFGVERTVECQDAVFLWNDDPPLPRSYPEKASDLLAFAREIGEEAVAVLLGADPGRRSDLVVLIAAPGRGGAGQVAVRLSDPMSSPKFPGQARDPIGRGFRTGKVPAGIRTVRSFGDTPVVRTGASRADASWIHGRGSDPRSDSLLAKKVVVVGCGSVGGPLACTLARAGVGRSVLVDPEPLAWANVGRHPLGATSVGLSKALELAKRLQADYPHLHIEGRNVDVRGLVVANDPSIADADLVVCATGSWAADHAVNRWHLATGRSRPVLHAWTEAHACAGHGVLVGSAGGCLQCHLDAVGRPELVAVELPDEMAANREEPACGAHYQPYGPVELELIGSMLSELALDALLDPPSSSIHRVALTSHRRIDALGGRVADWLSGMLGTRSPPSGFLGGVVESGWSPSASCPACSGSGQAMAA